MLRSSAHSPLFMRSSIVFVSSALVLVACTPAKNAGATFTVEMNKQGFTPQEISVKKDDRVCWKNSDDVARWPASNIHPTHDIYPAFDPKAGVRAGDTWCFTFDKEGIWQFHDHLLPEFGGRVVVE